MTEEKFFNTRKQKAFEYISEGAKQLITLGAGIIAFTVTFTKDVFMASTATVKISNFGKAILIASWEFYFLSIFAGILTIYLLASQLKSDEELPDSSVTVNEDDLPSFKKRPVSVWIKIQQIFFMAGLLFVGFFGIINLFSEDFVELNKHLSDSFTVGFIILLPIILFVILLGIFNLTGKKKELNKSVLEKSVDAYYSDNKIYYRGEALKPRSSLRLTVLSEDVDNPLIKAKN